MARPSPIPSLPALVVKKGSVTRGRSAGAMPAPLSETASRTSPGRALSSSRTQPSRPTASSAFKSRLTSTCSSRTRPASTGTGPGGAINWGVTPTARARGWTISSALSAVARASIRFSAAGSLREKLFSRWVVRCMRRISPRAVSMRCAAGAASVSASRLAVASVASIAAMGWLISWTMAADMRPRAAIFSAWIRVSCVARNSDSVWRRASISWASSSVRSVTRRSSICDCPSRSAIRARRCIWILASPSPSPAASAPISAQPKAAASAGRIGAATMIVQPSPKGAVTLVMRCWRSLRSQPPGRDSNGGVVPGSVPT